MAWLDAHQPPNVDAACVIHNDYKYDNLVLHPYNLSTIQAVLDWEMATIGDPLMDLGASLAYWVERDDPAGFQAMRMMPTNADGAPTRAEVVARYAAKSGLEAMSRMSKAIEEIKHSSDETVRILKTIDESDGYYRGTVEKESRSWMNVPFTLADAALDGKFLEQASAAGLKTLKGHRSVGGIRVSMYNAITVKEIEQLVREGAVGARPLRGGEPPEDGFGGRADGGFDRRSQQPTTLANGGTDVTIGPTRVDIAVDGLPERFTRGSVSQVTGVIVNRNSVHPLKSGSD